ncbi:unnamed protein product [Bursaphelenchus okinawaensis]|uniref:Uncharacterized protein n=1 Tax=Bursaphelenchus okinawaensis TaxID=465554 RepID=A0A811K461_9BILA|nr:unnamed protein product [Bursaphelenchus okinawaensis]CAG9091978.1 unnamed protein product [Bursaphelenchus okinawaensis]
MRFLQNIVLLVVFTVVKCEDENGWKHAVLEVPEKDGSKHNVNLNYGYSTKYGNNDSPVILHLSFGLYDDVVRSQLFLIDLADHLNATVIVIQHRSYNDDIGAFQPSQALSDFNALYKHFTEGEASPVRFKKSQKVILSGYGYAGFLALWFYTENNNGRFKSALISDAPINLYKGFGLSLGAVDNHLKKVYEQAGCKSTVLNNALEALKTENLTDFQDIASILGLKDVDKVPEDDLKRELQILTYFIHDAFIKLAADEQDFAEKREGTEIIAKPVESYCNSVNVSSQSLEGRLYPIKRLLNILNKDKYSFDDLDDYKLMVLKCNYLVPYSCPHGPNNDFFTKECQNEEEWKRYWKSLCSRFNKDNDPKWDFAKQNFEIDLSDLKNVVFVYGEDDVWSVTKPKTNALTYVIPFLGRSRIFDQPNSCDSNTLKQFRYQLINLLDCFLDQNTNDICGDIKGHLPQYEHTNETECSPEVLAYPWGQTLFINETIDDSSAAGFIISWITLFFGIVITLF